MGFLDFVGLDGVSLAYQDVGSGRPVVLLHGFMGTGEHWFGSGLVAKLIEQKFRVLVPDLRGHGRSDSPRAADAYPPDVLADDALAFIDHLGFGPGDYDLAGYSLGGRIVVRLLARGAEPGRAVVAGQGLAKVNGPQGGGVSERALVALRDGVALEPDSAEAQIAGWAARLGADSRALLGVLSSLVPTPENELAAMSTPTLVLIGEDDERSDADQLAARLPAGRFSSVPGGHAGAFSSPEFAAEVLAFLATG